MKADKNFYIIDKSVLYGVEFNVVIFPEESYNVTWISIRSMHFVKTDSAIFAPIIDSLQFY